MYGERMQKNPETTEENISSLPLLPPPPQVVYMHWQRGINMCIFYFHFLLEAKPTYRLIQLPMLQPLSYSVMPVSLCTISPLQILY